MRRFYIYVVLSALGYVAVTAVTFLIKSTVDLVDIVTLGKIFSLSMLIVVNGDVASDNDMKKPDIRISNYTILAVSLLLTIINTMKFFTLDIQNSSVSAAVKPVLQFLYSNVSWLSAFPLVAYAILDFYIAYLRTGTSLEKDVARKFLVFVDIPCVFPLIAIYALVVWCSQRFHADLVGVEIFLSGSMAIVLMASAIATKAVEHYFGDALDVINGRDHA